MVRAESKKSMTTQRTPSKPPSSAASAAAPGNAIRSPHGERAAHREVARASWRGIALAGGLYPWVAVLLRLVALASTSGWDVVPRHFDAWGELAGAVGISVALAIFAFPVCFLWAGLVGMILLAGLWISAECCGLHRQSVAIATTAGGLTGSLCMLLSGMLDRPVGANAWTGVSLYVLAIAMGQGGGWWAARTAAARAGLRQGDRRRRGPGREHQPRWRLRQLFAWTTIVCIVAASLAALGGPVEFYQILAVGLAIQAALAAAVSVVLRFRRST